MKKSSLKKGAIIFLIFAFLAGLVWYMETREKKSESVVVRNEAGGGKKTEEYQYTIEGETKKESLNLDVHEREYTSQELQHIFEQMAMQLDKIILGDNESFDRVEKDLHLVTEIDGYPMQIRWEFDSYGYVNMDGKIIATALTDEGTLLEVRGIISYGEITHTYIRNVMLYPRTRVGKEKLAYEIHQALIRAEEETRKDNQFSLPTEVDGKTVTWSKGKASTWPYLLVLGMVLAVYLVYREREQVKKEERKRQTELLKEYPGLLSKMTMLLGTGTTLRNAWEKIVENYEAQKQDAKSIVVYEEMKHTIHEMQGGISETEAYERFGRRCGLTVYLKFGALLSQNLRKGSKGLADILRMEAIQSFEDRKSMAKRKGEEAGSKLMMPMVGMLAVVMIIVIVPAFMSMQL